MIRRGLADAGGMGPALKQDDRCFMDGYPPSLDLEMITQGGLTRKTEMAESRNSTTPIPATKYGITSCELPKALRSWIPKDKRGSDPTPH